MWGSQAYFYTPLLKEDTTGFDRIDRRPQTTIGADHAISKL